MAQVSAVPVATQSNEGDLSMFKEIHKEVFGKLPPESVIKFKNRLIADNRIIDIRNAAYILATVKHETGDTFQPVKEAYWLSETWRKKNLRYYPWYGRGFVQITWERNYRMAGEKLGKDFITFPEATMDYDNSYEITVRGMLEGWFTGISLKQVNNYKAARKVVNGTDRADLIASYAFNYEKCLGAEAYASRIF
jgi:putative chitinase